ncbi:MetQ/NlpA family ABC transporter substrate-binding protein [Urinicoccus timonensis]|uniref:MetQ/NlpA family ABC transporter substrate-binding protein n=1 Tax=Urinicoccus timonensis TaxID=2024205 RepID=UPI000C084AFC|nr:MetQ/NlpA family ABC transporter substrate-binding protein [Urinicoccus timonensis]
MKKMKKFILASLLSCLVLLTACGQKASPDQGAGDNKIRLGVSPVPHEEIIKALEPEFKKAGLDVEVTTFDDYVMPNLALDQGDLDANFFQHAPYLDDFIKERGVKLANLGAVHLEPIGFYSDKYKSVDELKDGDEILIPNDATNGGRALILLEKAGVIKLNDSSNLAVTEKDITENPKNLKFTALDAPSIPRSYKEVAGAVINSNYALGAGLDPTKDSLLTEDKDSPYANIIAVRQGEEGQEKFKKFMEVLHSEACRKFIEDTYKGAVVPAF